jgi:glycosyltransferase involved in cell wall biosynthesis
MDIRQPIGYLAPSPLVNSGYGRHVRNIVTRSKKFGGNPIVFGNQHFGDNLNYNGIVVTPRLNHPYLADILPYLVQKYSTKLVVNMWDFWAMDYLADVKKLLDFKYIHWIPCDCILKPESVTEANMKVLKEAEKIFSVSQFSTQQFKNLGFDAVYIPIGIDSEIYRPMQNKKELKKKYGFPEDSFVIGFVGKNISTRKGISELMQAVKIFKEGLPESERSKIKLYLHTDREPSAGNSFDLVRMGKFYGIQDIILFPSVHMGMESYDDATMADIYNCMDVFASTSKGEGFNAPLLEALSCGLPIVAHSTTAHIELMEDTDSIGVMSSNFKEMPLWTNLITEYETVDAGAFAMGLHYIWTKTPEERIEMGKRGRKKAETFTWDDSYRRFITELERL